MTSPIDRRRFLRTSAALASGIPLAGGLSARLARAADEKPACRQAISAAPATPHAAKLGWRVTMAHYTFNKLSCLETLQEIRKLGLNTSEGFEWQKIGGGIDGQTNPSLSPEQRDALRKQIADSGVQMIGLYCRDLNSEKTARPTLQFAKEMGIRYLVAEPDFDAYDMLEQLCAEYKVKLAVHNHPAPSRYFDPKTTLKMVKDRGPWIGACCDTGHWVRSGFKPVDALKMLEGHITSFHLKDVSQFGVKEAHCVPWGEGAGEIGAILKEMHRQGWKGDFGIEYEPYKPTNDQASAKCIAFLEKTAAELG